MAEKDTVDSNLWRAIANSGREMSLQIETVTYATSGVYLNITILEINLYLSEVDLMVGYYILQLGWTIYE